MSALRIFAISLECFDGQHADCTWRPGGSRLVPDPSGMTCICTCHEAAVAVEPEPEEVAA